MASSLFFPSEEDHTSPVTSALPPSLPPSVECPLLLEASLDAQAQTMNSSSSLSAWGLTPKPTESTKGAGYKLPFSDVVEDQASIIELAQAQESLLPP